MKTRILALAVAAALSGCASLPSSQVAPEAAVTAIPRLAPSSNISLKEDLAIDRWWTVFADHDLDRLMDEALARNEDLERAVARVREAQAGLDLARAAQSPTLDLQVRNGRSQQSEVGATPLPRGVERRANTHRVSLEAGYELDLWGRLSSSSAAARQRLLATEWARATLEWSLTARLAEAYFGLAAVDRQIEISEAVRASRATTVQLRSRELAAGVGSEFDLRRAEAELTGTEATLASLARSRAALERAVTALLGRTPAEIAVGRIARMRIDERRAFPSVLPQGSAADLLLRRPDIRQAEAELAAANHSIEAARAGALPSVRLTGNIGTDAAAVGNLFRGASAIWSLFATLTQALADGGKAEARFHEEKARAEQSLAGYRKTVAGAVLDVREAYETLDITRQAFDAERSRAASLARAHQLARLGHQHGALNTLDLLDAERNWYQAQLQQVSAYRDQLVAQVSAFKALGGGHAGAIQQGSLQ
jgi:multidrug efflux system outer membrane protein